MLAWGSIEKPVMSGARGVPMAEVAFITGTEVWLDVVENGEVAPASPTRDNRLGSMNSVWQ
jgi:hypothetical protein